MNIYEKLQTTQQQLKAPKGQYNSFGKYNYRSCEDILEGLKPILSEVKAAVTINDEVTLIGDRYYIKATANFIDIADGNTISSTAYAREDQDKKGMDASQITGSVSSYARKYALNGLFCIDDTKDSDNTNTHGKGNSEGQSDNSGKTPRDEKIKNLIELAKRKGYSESTICKQLSIKEIKSIKDTQIDSLMEGYSKLPDKAV